MQREDRGWRISVFLPGRHSEQVGLLSKLLVFIVIRLLFTFSVTSIVPMSMCMCSEGVKDFKIGAFKIAAEKVNILEAPSPPLLLR